MLGRALGLPFLITLLLVPGCEAGGGTVDSGGGMDAGVDSAIGMDAGVETCTTTAECDDGFPCTLDECVVGNVCDHDPLDARCDAAAGESCVVGRGCVVGTPSDCATSVDCNDGDRCNGVETCIVERGVCLPGTAPDCDDGNACTIDTCHETGGMCQYELAPGCDGGGVGIDAGPPCLTFDAPTDYTGTFLLTPPQSCSAGGGLGYSVGTMVFSVAGGTLTVRVGGFTLTQSPVPTGNTFDVSGSDSCANVRITGTFDCENHFDGMWTANHTGCAACGTVNRAIDGVK